MSLFRPLMITLALSLVIGVATLSGGGASAAPSPTPSASPSTSPTPTGVLDAAAFRDDLLRLAMGNLDAIAAHTFEGVFPAWQAAYPTLEFDGYAIPAGPNDVSIWYNYLYSKKTPGAANPEVVAFAVLDTAGRCTFGAVYGFPKLDQQWTAARVGSGPCTASAGVDLLGAHFQAPTTAPASPTTTAPALAPGPPATGSGFGPSSASPWAPISFAAGVLMTTIACACVALRKRNRALNG